MLQHAGQGLAASKAGIHLCGCMASQHSQCHALPGTAAAAVTAGVPLTDLPSPHASQSKPVCRGYTSKGKYVQKAWARYKPQPLCCSSMTL